MLTFSTPKYFLRSSNWWKLPAGSKIPEGLTVVNDVENQWMWIPVEELETKKLFEVSFPCIKFTCSYVMKLQTVVG